MKICITHASLLVALVVLPVAQALAQEAKDAPEQTRQTVAESLSGQAQVDFVDGLALFEAGNHQAALWKFSRAHLASKEPRILYNMASCHEKLRQYVKARAALRQFKKEALAAGLIDAQRGDEIEVFLRTYDRLIGKIVVAAEPAGVLVHVDDVEIGTTPLPGPLEIEEGAHRVRLTKAGFLEWSTTVTVDGGDQVSNVMAKLQPARHEGRLVVRTAIHDAAIRVDGIHVGIGQLERAFPSGTHHVVVSAKGRRTREFDIVVVDDETRRFDVTLDAESNSLMWLWVVGGATAALGAATVGLVMATRRDEVTAPSVPNGTLALPLGL